MASKNVINIANRFKLIQPSSRNSWPWTVPANRILVLFFPWMNSKEKHISKYTDIYTDLGLDVLIVEGNIKDFLWPPESLKTARSLVKVLHEHNKDYDNVFIHTMSVGAYNLTSFRMLLNDDKTMNYQLEKICALIYDSVLVGTGKRGIVKDQTKINDGTDSLVMMITGVSKSIGDSKLLSFVVNIFAKIYFALTKSKTLDFYVKGFDFVRDQPLKVPTLVLASKDDPMTDHKTLTYLADIWKNDHSVPVRMHLWDKSGHCQHLQFHREEYLELQRQFMKELFGKSKL